MATVIVLLLLFQLKHFLADYTIQMSYNSFFMRKFDNDRWIFPLACHSVSHACFTFLISMMFTTWTLSLLLACFDFIVHFTMDRIKASPNMMGKYKMDDVRYWNALGVDQMVHHLTHYVIIFSIVGIS